MRGASGLRWLVSVAVAATIVVACGGGGGSGGKGSGSGGLPAAELPELSTHYLGAIGYETAGWRIDRSYGGSRAASAKDPLNFHDPRGVFVTPDGTIYVADTYAARISRWSALGAPLGWIGAGQEGWRTDDTPAYDFFGEGELEFERPVDVHVDGDGMIFVVDSENHRICRWDQQGRFQGWIGGGNAGWMTGDAPRSAGRDLGEFDLGLNGSIFVDAAGDIYVSEKGGRLSRWSADGTPLGRIDGMGGGRAFVDGDGTIFVAEDHHVSRWSSTGEPMGWIGGGEDGWQSGPAPEAGLDLRSFDEPKDVAVDASGYIYVLDRGTSSVSKWDADGNAIGRIGGGVDGWHDEPTPERGIDPRSFRNPWALHVTGDGTITVADAAFRISRWSAEGQALGWLGGGEPGWSMNTPYVGYWVLGQLYNPSGVAVDASGNVYVSEAYNRRVSKFDPHGVALGWIGAGRDGWQTGYAPERGGPDFRSFAGPMDVGLDGDGNIYVLDSLEERVCKWDPDGNAIGHLRPGIDATWHKDDIEGSLSSGTDSYMGIHVEADGSFLMALGPAIRRYAADGAFMGGLGGGRDGWHQGPFDVGTDMRSAEGLYDVAVDADGCIYVVDCGLERLQKWSPEGEALGWLGGGGHGFKTRSARSNERGSTNTRFFNPTSVAVAEDGTILVADSGNDRITRWDRHGNAAGELLPFCRRMTLLPGGKLYLADGLIPGVDLVRKWWIEWD